MGKKTIFAAMIPNRENPPELGYTIDWHDDYISAYNSPELISGFFKASSVAGGSNIMVFSENTPDVALDISDMEVFSGAWVGGTTDVNVRDNPNLESVDGDEPIESLHINATSITEVSNIAAGGRIFIEEDALTTEQVDELLSPVKDVGVIVENKGNASPSDEVKASIEAAGGTIHQDTSSLMRFQTDSAVTTAFQFFVDSGADVDWLLDGVLHTADSNTATFFFTDASVKTIEIRGTNVSDGHWLGLNSKSVVGTADLAAMTNAQSRIDVQNNPNLDAVIFPDSVGVFDSFFGMNTNIRSLRFDKLPNMVNSNSVQLRCNNMPNLNTDDAARNILKVDTASNTGRIFFISSSPPLDSGLQADLVANGWTIA